MNASPSPDSGSRAKCTQKKNVYLVPRGGGQDNTKKPGFVTSYDLLLTADLADPDRHSRQPKVERLCQMKKHA
jgi:hypothetical protein